MGLISGILMGMIVGIALMAGWYHMMRYRSTNRVTKAIDIKLLGCLSRDDLKKICGDNYPEWISFPVYEQVKWLNKQLSKLWPFVAEAATMVIRESVEPLLEEYRPPGITSLKFSKLSLGDVAPKIEGIHVQSLKKGQITMDIDFRWGGDPNIILAVEAALVASIPIQLKDLQVFTVVRVIFQLSEEIPCISAIVFALLSEPKPRIDYTLKAVGGSLTALPGISDMIDDTVNSIVTDMLQWPHRIVVPIGGTQVDTSELELKPQGKLIVTVVKADELKNMEMIGKSDPYVILYIRPLFKVKTKVIDNNLNPIWNETFELIAEDKETQSLILEVFDKDVTQDKRLGIVKLPLADLEPETPKDIELRLLPSLDMLKVKDKKDRGSLIVKVLYHQLDKKEQLVALEEEKVILEGRRKLKEEGVIGSTRDALDGAASLVGSGVGLVGTGIGAGVGLVGTGIGSGMGLVGTGIESGAGLVGTGIQTGAGLVGTGIQTGAGLVGTGIGAGAGLVGNGINAGVGFVGSGFGAMSSGLSKAGKLMGRSLGHSGSSKRSGNSTL
ncbi:PREDICTED: synaptotagmin-4-like isoform X1 [Nelumbo nucifera]|uniref:Synaptotagmin-4-like isoform X1 n=1 Tax=Nelumbo nucifera TaxID=4432 RepID=A0A1U7Z679_NELNU|nr:PREDICTED: synaptotagmin-4-like isoform X1 [Nelumbo nucifera]